MDEYFSALPPRTKSILQTLRKTIKQAAPKAEELISYNMPAFKMHGMLVYYAAFAKHVSLFPFSSAIQFFSRELSAYETSKGTIKFQLDKKLPIRLIKKIVRYRVAENTAKARLKLKAKK